MIKKYVKIYWALLKVSLISDMEFRFNLIIKIVTDILWYLAQASVFEVLFYRMPQISGWNLPTARVFLATLFFADALWMVLFHENFERLSTKVRRGELDFLLLKPINSQFMVTLQKQNSSYLLNLALTFLYLIWTTQQLTPTVPWWKFLLLLFIGIPCSQIILYSCRLTFALLAIIFINAESINYIWYQLYRLGLRPDSFYPYWLRLLVLSFVPVGFIASVPSRMLVEEISLWMFFAGPLLSLILFFFTKKMWQKVLVYYSSASS
ncbi:MAG: ABC-2 family transporter protein [Bdellovibrionales bacterium]|nr:ABC-2 family transporter protein [Bdellovibrionales bacterium]